MVESKESLTRTIKITKLDAARRQLHTAIELWFADGDPVSIHALAYAAHEIIHRIFRNLGHRDLFYDSTLVSDDDRKKFVGMAKTSANFFKHAEREISADDSHEFAPVENMLYLYMSVCGLRALTKLSETEKALSLWFALNFPHGVMEGVKDSATVEFVKQFRNIHKRDFLAVFHSYEKRARSKKR